MSKEAEKLAERLRTRNGSATGFGIGPVCDEAASLIERQAEQIRELRAALSMARNICDVFGVASATELRHMNAALSNTKEET